MKRFLAYLVAITTLLAADIAAACPVCAGREEPGNLRWVALGAMVLSPWLVALAVALYIRRSVAVIPAASGDLSSGSAVSPGSEGMDL